MRVLVEKEDGQTTEKETGGRGWGARRTVE